MRRAVAVLLASIAGGAAAQVGVTDFLGRQAAPGYAEALAPRAFRFPADHGPHPEFRSEWWYFTGHLAAQDRRRFGFQLTFFRTALAPEAAPRGSAWATRQAWMAHFTLTDVANGRFDAFERLGRGALGIAGAEASPFRVWIDDWQAASLGPETGLFPLRLVARSGATAIELRLSALKPLVLQGEDGWDRKGPGPGDASYYYSYTRLAAEGSLSIGDEMIAVTGSAWMDREWSSNALGTELVGWDWFSLQLSDGRELMYYRLRRKDGSAGSFSSGSLVLESGELIPLAADAVRLRPRRYWQSPRGPQRYPVAWSIEIPAQGITLDLEPLVDDQELDLTVRYWEGAVRADGRSDDRPISGQGYLELVGY